LIPLSTTIHSIFPPSKSFNFPPNSSSPTFLHHANSARNIIKLFISSICSSSSSNDHTYFSSYRKPLVLCSFMVFNFALMDKNGFFSTATDDSLNERLICDLLACVSAKERNLCSRNEFEYFSESFDTFNDVFSRKSQKLWQNCQINCKFKSNEISQLFNPLSKLFSQLFPRKSHAATSRQIENRNDL
jgi:hypothetical protein